MNYTFPAARVSCSCGFGEDEFLKDAATVPAGDVGSGLGACGYERGFSRLPDTDIKPQTYREGLCPDAALTFGTMFPELVSVYK
ncbi:MAG: spore coat associated protein CotJA [Clostridia bacterium]|nr:spore coat associated protein CotJA [Clostridia bacterium]